MGDDAMIKFTLALTGLIAAMMFVAPAAQAQNPPPPPSSTTKQRIPGAPPVPRPDEASRAKPDDRGKVQGDRRGQNGERPPLQPDRELPMPKPVPSIIAPSR